METVDVLVVGLGPAGGSAARCAAARGLRVLGVERNRRIGVPVQCAEFIPAPMARYASAAGVRVQSITGMKSALPSGARLATAFPGIMIDRARFDQSIAQRAREAGAVLWEATRLVGLDPTQRLARLQRNGLEVEVRYRLLVAADGPHSTVGRNLGLPALEVVHTRQYTVPLRGPYADTDIWLSDAYPGGYGWLFPKGAVANLGLGADRALADADLKTPLDRLHRQLVDTGIVGPMVLQRTGGAIPVGGLRRRLVEGRVVFVGDAAGLTHPISGAGIAAAVVSGERAGEAAAACLGADSFGALADFEEDVRDQYEGTICRALERRAFLNRHWHTPAAHDDHVLRRGWIAFDEYFAEQVAGVT
ncbi:MAG: geranylgeranyl reductase [Chromatiales bacterium 21-64-14]|nr:MAG: geranylgeranyl reductase [Chromatiales bacterium 21-64-14]HQU16035.1 NAD(P)/FAD-dependent oxidoreductase [Gammaproteobacteria bacterium]